ncbi:glycosyltransferase family 1 protein [Parabacteroides sp. Y3-G-102]|uniref:glycosyltransferase family 1 protein n=1 Tax=Parabacteroides TaxID=375288 RepID=UPI00202F9A6D|nr:MULTISPECIES: glycosyltransferase family 1 protein [Parabacteroides]MCM0727494.1 glycosyltransferase family 1 protein [Parabacteroides sp. Y3-G-102]
MKALFLIFHGFNPANGISKKIHYQVNGLKACGVDTRLCYMDETTGRKLRMVDNHVLRDYGSGLKSKLLKRTEYSSIIEYARKERIDFVYMRSDHNANPFTIHMVRKLKETGIKVVMEIPTYPYDQEYESLSRRKFLFIDQCFRKILARQLSGIVTFSDYPIIFGKPALQISNGVDFSQIPLKRKINDTNHELHLIGVAEIHYWHGFDRLVRGLANYYQTHPSYKVYFHIIGEFFGEREKKEILPVIKQHGLEEYIILHGARHGKELDDLFEQADMAIGSLARHRSGIIHIKTLKNREYAARGLSFIYSEIDSDFENKPYILKAKADESPIDIYQIIEFYKWQKLSPEQIRNSILSLSWKSQMNKVLSCLMVDLFTSHIPS